jgi:transcriptional antiterminator
MKKKEKVKVIKWPPKEKKIPGIKILCSDCKKREATIEFCNSVLEFSHGFTEHICEDCYRNRLLRKIDECKKAIAELDKKKEEKNGRT